jgi:hypothetical protein
MTDTNATGQDASEEGGGCDGFDTDSLLKMAALTRENPNAASLLLTILAEVGDESVLVVSEATLAKLCNSSVLTIEQAIVDLVEEDWISRMVIGAGEPTPMAYVVNSRMNWSEKGETREYVNFQAQVVISGADNSYLKSDPAST